MVRPGLSSGVVMPFRLLSYSLRTRLPCQAGLCVRSAGSRLARTLSTTRLLRAARVDSPTVIQPVTVPESPRDAFTTVTRRISPAAVLVCTGVAAPAPACATDSTTSPPASVVGEPRVTVSHSSILGRVTLRSKPKLGSPLCVPVGSASILFPFCFSFFLASTAGASVVDSPSQRLLRALFSQPATAHSPSAATIAQYSAVAYHNPTIHRTAAPPQRKTGATPSNNIPAEYTNALADSREKYSFGSLVSISQNVQISPSWDSVTEPALSHSRRAFYAFSSFALPLARKWRWPRRVQNRSQDREAAQLIAPLRLLGATPVSPAATRARRLSSFLDSRRGTMATMGGFDPKVLDAAAKEGVNLTLCLCTHKHYDHAGGNEELARMMPGLEIAGSAYEETPGVNKFLKNKDTVNLGENLRIEALHAPCHTAGHLLYFVTNAKQPTLAPILFSGDTLFVGGCGRFFEGSPQQMFHALIDICGSLPSHTRVYCGHEYTKANLEFALSIEPNNEDLKAKYKWATQQRSSGHPTIPSTIAQEKCYNPFMRVETNNVQSAVGALGDPIETMRLLREKKNSFK